MQVPTLTTERTRLEPLSYSHSRGVYALWSDPLVCEHSGTVKDYQGNVLETPVAARQTSDCIIDFWLRAASDGWGFRWAIMVAASGRFAGTVGFNSLSGDYEVAFHLLPELWEKGLMSEALHATIKFSESRDATGVEAFVDPENDRSRALVGRLGLVATPEFSGGAQRYVRRFPRPRTGAAPPHPREIGLR